MRRITKNSLFWLLAILGMQWVTGGSLWAATVVDVAITKVADVAQAATGETITYTLTVTNKGTAPSDAPGVKVTDTLPAGLTIESVEAPGTYNCSNTVSTLVCDRTEDLPIGNSDIITVKAKVDDDIEDETLLSNNAEANASAGASEFEPSDNSSSVDVEVVTCGNDQLAFNEDCDDGNTNNGDCCSSKCTYDSSDTACDEGNPFSRGRCDGSGFCELEQLTLDEAIANCSLNREGTGGQKAWWALLPLGFFLLRRRVLSS